MLKNAQYNLHFLEISKSMKLFLDPNELKEKEIKEQVVITSYSSCLNVNSDPSQGGI